MRLTGLNAVYALIVLVVSLLNVNAEFEIVGSVGHMNEISSKFSQRKKALLAIAVTFSGMTRWPVIDLHPLNALDPICVTLEGMMPTLSTTALVQPSSMLLPMAVRFSGRWIDVMLAQCLKSPLWMVVS